MTEKRWCFYLPEGDSEAYVPGSGWIPARIEEGTPGYRLFAGTGEHSSPWFWGEDVETARRMVSEANARIGITPEIANEILMSNMRASYGIQEG